MAIPPYAAPAPAPAPQTAPLRMRSRAAAAPERDGGEDSAQAERASDTLRAADRERRARDKDFAYRKILALRERVRALKLLADANPQALPQAVAQLSKELASAVKEYQEAGGKGGSNLANVTAPVADDTPEDAAEGATKSGESREPTPADLRARNAYRERQNRQRAEELESDAMQDSAFVRDTRGIIKKLREFLEIGAQDRDPDSEEGKDATDANRHMRKAEKILDGLEGDANSARLTGKLLKMDA